jgi:hypothetical protein
MMPYQASMIFKAAGRGHRHGSLSRTSVIPYHMRFKPYAIKESPIYLDFAAACRPGHIGEVATFHDDHVRDYERYCILDNQGEELLQQHTYDNIMNTMFIELAVKGRLSPTLICWFESLRSLNHETVTVAHNLLTKDLNHQNIKSRRVLEAVFNQKKLQ